LGGALPLFPKSEYLSIHPPSHKASDFAKASTDRSADTRGKRIN